MRDHSGDLALVFRGENLSDLLTDAALALAEAIGAPDRGRIRKVAIRTTATDPEGLIVSWLNELIVLVETKGLVPISADARVADHREGADRYAASATITARKPSPGYSPLALPKAATWHGLRVARTRAGWSGRVILDL